MLIGTGTDPSKGINNSHIYESFDRGDDLTDIATVPVDLYNMSMAYGGWLNGVANPDVFYVGAGSSLYLRTTSGGPITKLSAYAGDVVRQMVLDPNDWRRAIVTDQSRHVWMTTDAGATFTDITGNLPIGDLGNFWDSATAVFDANAADGDIEVLFATVQGVYRTINPLAGAGALWFQYGQNLPHVITSNLVYNSTDDVVMAATVGRGAWTVPNATSSLVSDLEIDGDTDSPGQNDTIRLAARAGNSNILDVYVNSSTPTFSTYLSLIQSIHVDGMGGNNTLIEDFSNGNPLPAGGLSYRNAALSVIPAAASHFVVSGFPSPSVAGVAHTFTVVATDAYGNVATGYQGTAHFTSSDGQAALPADYTFTAADGGSHSFPATLYSVGTQSIAVDGNTGISGSQTDIVVTTPAPMTFVVTNTNDAGPGSLRQAIMDANANPARDTIKKQPFWCLDRRRRLEQHHRYRRRRQRRQDRDQCPCRQSLGRRHHHRRRFQ